MRTRTRTEGKRKDEQRRDEDGEIERESNVELIGESGRGCGAAGCRLRQPCKPRILTDPHVIKNGEPNELKIALLSDAVQAVLHSARSRAVGSPSIRGVRVSLISQHRGHKRTSTFSSTGDGFRQLGPLPPRESRAEKSAHSQSP